MKRPVFLDVVVVLGLLVLLVGGYLYVQRDAPAASADHTLLEMRLVAHQFGWHYNGLPLPGFDAHNAVSNQEAQVPREGFSVLLLLGKEGCSPCQVRELRNLDSLFTQTNRAFPVTSVYYNDIGVTQLRLMSR